MPQARQRDIELAINEHGLAGRPVCLHSSLRSLGRVARGPRAVIDAFLQAGSTILVPTFSWAAFSQPPPDGRSLDRNGTGWDYAPGTGHDRVFDTASTDIDADMGAIPAEVLTREGHARGDHPLCSFTALGPDAESLVASQTNLDVFAPLRALCETDGRILLMGVGLNSMTLLHLAEQEAGRQPFVRWALDESGGIVPTQVGGCSEGFSRLEARLEASPRRVGPSAWRVYDAKAALRMAVIAIRRGPSITDCGRPSCARCPDAIAGGPCAVP